MLKRFVGTRTLDVIDIPAYMNELDNLEDIYFGKKTVKGAKELAKLRGLFMYCWVLNPPGKASIHTPYNLLAYLAKVAPKGSEEEFITEKLRDYGYLKEGEIIDENLRVRIKYAFNWVETFEEIRETSVKINLHEKAAIQELINVLKDEGEAGTVTNAIFNIAKKHGLKPPSFFKTLYLILIGVPQGPRLGPYIIAMGKQNVIDALQKTQTIIN
jgi:lysyl-tRNA synthetase class 1